MRRPISESTKDGKTIKCGIEFECLFDIPFGIMRLIRDKYYDPKIFNRYWMIADNYTLRCFLYERLLYNPIYESLIDKDYKYAESLLKEITNTDTIYNQVLDLSPKINMFELARMHSVINDKGVGSICDIICKTNLQVKFIKKAIPNCKTRLVKNFNIDLSQYDLLILERYLNIMEYIKHCDIENKTIWIPEFWYNLDKAEHTKPDLGVSVVVADTNKVSTYEPYNNFIKPVG